jgi:pimeloyl-ACP methyl ester carboxylesterase
MTTTASPATARVPGGTIAYRELGEGDPILFVHGLLVDGRLWDGVAERLSERFRCLVPDWPLGSHRIALEPDADLTPPGVARMIVSFIDSVGLDRTTVVGNDSGGAISQILAANHPERVERLVLTNCDTFEHFPPFPFALMPPIARLPGGMSLLAAPFRIGAVARATYGMLAERPAPELVADWLRPSLGDPAIRRDAGKFIAGAHKRHTLAAAAALRGFSRPVRFAWGTGDRFFRIADAERLAAMVPDGSVEPIAGAKTFVPLDRPEVVAELIARFMREPSGSPAATAPE